MKKVKKCISLLLVMYMLISPLYVNALSFEEIKEQTIKIKEDIKLNENTKFENVSLEINYDSLKNTDNIVNLLNESLENSKNAKETLTKVNTLIANIEEKNNELLNVDSKEEYNKLVKEVEEEN